MGLSSTASSRTEENTLSRSEPMKIDTFSKQVSFQCEEEISQLEDKDGFTYDEGGLSAWSVTLGSFIGILPTWGLYFSAGIIQTYIASHQLGNVPTSTISWIFSTYNFFVLSSTMFSGVYFDKYGARKPLILGSILFVGGMFVVAISKKVWHFVLSLSFGVGIGSGILTSPFLGCVCHYFYKRRALATAVAINGGSIGGIIFPLMLRSLYDKLGFEWAIRMVGFISVGCFSVAIFLVREDPLKLMKEHSKNQDKKKISLKRIYALIIDCFDYKALANSTFLCCTLGTCLAELATGTTLTYIASYCVAMGYSENNSFLVIIALNSMSIIGGYFYSFIADKVLGRFNVMIIINFSLGIVSLILWLPFGSKSKNVMYAFGLVYGFFYGSLLNLAPVCCGQISRTDQFGKRYATMYSLVSIFFLIGLPISGAIIGDGKLHNYNGFIIYSALLSIISSIFFLLSKSFAVNKYDSSSQNETSSRLYVTVYKNTLKRF